MLEYCLVRLFIGKCNTESDPKCITICTTGYKGACIGQLQDMMMSEMSEQWIYSNAHCSASASWLSIRSRGGDFKLKGRCWIVSSSNAKSQREIADCVFGHAVAVCQTGLGVLCWYIHFFMPTECHGSQNLALLVCFGFLFLFLFYFFHLKKFWPCVQ